MAFGTEKGHKLDQKGVPSPHPFADKICGERGVADQI